MHFCAGDFPRSWYFSSSRTIEMSTDLSTKIVVTVSDRIINQRTRIDINVCSMAYDVCISHVIYYIHLCQFYRFFSIKHAYILFRGTNLKIDARQKEVCAHNLYYVCLCPHVFEC